MLLTNDGCNKQKISVAVEHVIVGLLIQITHLLYRYCC